MTGIPMDENKDLLPSIIAMAKHFDVYTAHFRPAQTQRDRWITAVAGDGKGFFDLVLVGPHGILFRELKAEGKYPTPQQREWAARTAAGGGDVGVWRPKEYRDGTVEAEIRGISRWAHEPNILAVEELPVRILTGRVSALVGSITDPAQLPALLRQAADQIEETHRAA